MRILTGKWMLTVMLMLGMVMPFLAEAQRAISGKVITAENAQAIHIYGNIQCKEVAPKNVNFHSIRYDDNEDLVLNDFL